MTEMKEHTIRLKAMDVHDVMGLTAHVDFHKDLTNMIGMIAAGRSRLFKCFYEARASACSASNAISDRIYKGVKAGSRISTVLSYDDIDVIYVMSYGEREVPDLKTDDDKETVKWMSWEWHVCNENGEMVAVVLEDTPTVDDKIGQMIYDCRLWLNHNVVMDINECLEHMSGLPYGILGSILGVRDESDISENIGKTIPWLSVFTREDDLLFWLDDMTDNLHTLVVRRFAEGMGSRARKSRCQFIMSSRDVDAMVDTYPCWFFLSGHAVRISDGIRDREEMYAFAKEGNRWSCWKNVLTHEPERVRDDVINKLKEVR